MKLSLIHWEDLHLNDKVELIATGQSGKISELSTKEEYPDDPENTITIDWDNGAVTYFCYHSWLDKVEYIGRKDFEG